MFIDSGISIERGFLPKVLVVDDRSENHRAIGNILTNLEAEIFTAMTGSEAISLSLRHDFSVILLDVMMPEMDGFETASVMRVNEDTQSTPIIFITAASRDDDFEFRGYEVGAVDYLFKPIKPVALKNKVKVFVDLDRKRTQLKTALGCLKSLEKRNQLILDSVGEGLVGLDKSGRVIFSNPAARELLGYCSDDIESLSFSDIFHDADPDKILGSWENSNLYQGCINDNRYHISSSGLVKSSREILPVEYTAMPIIDDDEFLGVVVAFFDISERLKSKERLENMAQFDSLTGLDNRHSFSLLLDKAISRCQRQNLPLSLLFLDLDKFKQVNDTLGHDVGDLLLKEVAERLKLCVRTGDVICRFGGDEFTIILEAIDSERSAAVVARKIISCLSEEFSINGCKIYVGVSIGISSYPGSGLDGESLLRCADIAMYKVKADSRNDYCFFTEHMDEEVKNDLLLDTQLRQAIENDQFELHFQPKINPYQNTIVGVESLIRWRDSNGDLIPPSMFIQKAEDTGLIIDIGNWVIRESCRIAGEWMRGGYLNEDFSVAVNLSVRQLQEPGLVDYIESTIADYDIPAKYIEFEITESVVMSDIDTSINILNRLHDIGVKISIDDFGTGYSSLSYLRRLPIDTLKIDCSFVCYIGISEQDNTIIKAIIALAHNLGLSVVAEGVENEIQLAYLKDHQCDVIQGYYYCEPMTFSESLSFFDRFI